MFITETKIKPVDEINIQFKNYNCYFNSNKTSYYHGVLFIVKSNLNVTVLNTTLPICNDNFTLTTTKNNVIINKYLNTIKMERQKAHLTEGRLLTIKVNDLVLVGTYCPNSGVNRQEPLKRLGYRILSWDLDLYHYINQLPYHNIVWLGDLNVTILNHDVLYKRNIAGTTEEEKCNINQFLTNHWVDSFDLLNQELKCKQRATWGVNTKYPMRLDYILCSPNLKDKIINSIVDQEYLGSDHVPLGTQFNFDPIL